MGRQCERPARPPAGARARYVLLPPTIPPIPLFRLGRTRRNLSLIIHPSPPPPPHTHTHTHSKQVEDAVEDAVRKQFGDAAGDMVHKGAETLNAKLADGKVSEKLHEYADAALAGEREG